MKKRITFEFVIYFRKGFPICDNSLLHGTAPVPAAPHAAAYTGAPAWNHGAASYAYQSAPVYNQWNAAPAHFDDGSYKGEAAYAYGGDYNDIAGPGGDK